MKLSILFSGLKSKVLVIGGYPEDGDVVLLKPDGTFKMVHRWEFSQDKCNQNSRVDRFLGIISLCPKSEESGPKFTLSYFPSLYSLTQRFTMFELSSYLQATTAAFPVSVASLQTWILNSLV